MTRNILSNLRLMDNNRNMYSANPDDYFLLNDDFVFKNMYLVATETKGDWSRVKVLKKNSRKIDLIKWAKKIKGTRVGD